MDVLTYCRVLRRAAWWILPLVAVVMLGTYLYARRLPKVYVATTKIMAPQRGGPSLSDGRGDSLLGLAAAAIGSQPTSTPALFLAYLESRAMAEAVGADVMRGYWITKAEELSGVEFRLNKSGTLIEIRVESPDPSLSAYVANAYPDQLDRMLRAVLTEEAGRQRRFLEARLSQARDSPPRFQADPDPTRALIQVLSLQVAQARISEARDLPTVQVLDRATAPRWPIGPNVRRIVQYAGLLALVGACLAAVGVDAVRRRRSATISRQDFEEAWAEHQDAAQRAPR